MVANSTLHEGGAREARLGVAAVRLPGLRRCPLRTNIIPDNQTLGNSMAWTTPILVEICIGLEINGYLPAEF